MRPILKCVALAIAFALTLLIFELPRSAQNKGSESIKESRENNSAHPKFLPSPVVQSATSQEKQNPSASVAPKDIEQPVRLRTPVAINSIKDRWDKGLVILTGCLVFASFFQIWFLLKTIKAANASVQALINSGRAWIITSIIWSLPDGKNDPDFRRFNFRASGMDTTPIDISFACKNDGKTPAWITHKYLWLRIYREPPPNIPDTTETPSFSYTGPDPLSV